MNRTTLTQPSPTTEKTPQQRLAAFLDTLNKLERIAADGYVRVKVSTPARRAS